MVVHHNRNQLIRIAPIPPKITKITGITDAMVAGHRIDDRAVNDLLGRVVLVIAHNADFDRRFLERRLPAFAPKHFGEAMHLGEYREVGRKEVLRAAGGLDVGDNASLSSRSSAVRFLSLGV